MIVDKENRGQGYGREAITTMIAYCLNYLNCKHFFVKIDEDNLASIRMFEKIGFVKYEYSHVFKQVALQLNNEQASEYIEKYSKIELKVDENYN